MCPSLRPSSSDGMSAHKNPDSTSTRTSSARSSRTLLLLMVSNVSPPPATVDPPFWDPALARGELPHHRRRAAAGAPMSTSVNTRKVHKPYSYAYYVHDNERPHGQDETDDRYYSRLRLYRGHCAAKHFMDQLKDDV